MVVEKNLTNSQHKPLAVYIPKKHLNVYQNAKISENNLRTLTFFNVKVEQKKTTE